MLNQRSLSIVFGPSFRGAFDELGCSCAVHESVLLCATDFPTRFLSLTPSKISNGSGAEQACLAAFVKAGTLDLSLDRLAKSVGFSSEERLPNLCPTRERALPENLFLRAEREGPPFCPPGVGKSVYSCPEMSTRLAELVRRNFF